MKKLLLAGVVLAGFAAPQAMAADAVRPAVAPAPAPIVVAPAKPGPQAWFGADYAWDHGSASGGGSIHGNTTSVSGAANLPIAGGPFNLEIEGRGSETTFSGLSTSLSVSQADGHVFWRAQHLAIGGFFGFDNNVAVSFRPVGAEAQVYLNKLSLYGQVASLSIQGLSTHNSWWTRGGVQLFLSPNLMLGADARWVTVGSSGPTVNGFLWGVNAEWRPTAAAWSVYGAYYSQKFTANGIGGNVSGNRALVGFRIHVGNGSLQQQYTTGASMNVLPALY